MKFDVPKTIKFLALQEYDPGNAALAGVGIHMWVDPPRSVLLEYDRMNGRFASVLDQVAAGQKPSTPLSGLPRLWAWMRVVVRGKPDRHFVQATDSYRRGVYAWFARMWSQHPDVTTHWTADELATMDAQNPAFFEWICRRFWQLLGEQRADIKKGSRPPLQGSPETEKPKT